MADKGLCVRAGQIGGVIWPDLLNYRSSKAQPICDRSTLDKEGLLSEGPTGTLYNSDLLNPAWVAPEDLQKPLKCQEIAEESLHYYRAHYSDEFVPLPLHRELLEEAVQFEELASNASLLGSRVAATWPGTEQLLVCSPVGKIGENLKLSVISGSPAERFQCEATTQAACSGMPIWQICFNRPYSGEDTLMVSVRTPYWICFFALRQVQADTRQQQASAGPSDGAKRWALQPAGALQTSQRLAHVCWNRCLPSLAAFSCEDGSLHTVNTAQEGSSAASLSAGSFRLLQANEVAGPMHPRPRHGRLVCEWAAQPNGLLLAAGQRLLRYDISLPGEPAVPRTLHSLGQGDAFVALATPGQPSGGPGYPDQAHLLAASTLRDILLMDLRRPGQSLLRWKHGMDREPPQLLALLPAQRQEAAGGSGAAPSAPAVEMALQRSPQPGGSARNFHRDVRHSQFGPLQSQYGSSSQLPEEWAPTAGPMQQEQLATQASQLGGQKHLIATQASQADPPVRLGNPAANSVGSNGGGQQEQQKGQQTRETPRLRGMVAAANLGAGDALSFAFAIRPQQVCLHADPPAAQRNSRGTHTDNPWGRIWAACSAAALPESRQDGRVNTGAGVGFGHGSEVGTGQQGGFTWVPRSLANAQSLGLPRRICWPLQLHARPEGALAGAASPEAAKELEVILRDAPDLQGIAFVAGAANDSAAPDMQPRLSQASSNGALMLRLDFLGHLHLQSTLFPWASRTPAAGSQEVGVVERMPLLGSVIQQHHPDLEADYIIPQEVPVTMATTGEALSNVPLRAERPCLFERDLVCDLSIHHSIAQKAMQDWTDNAGEAMKAGPSISESSEREHLLRLLSSMKVPLTMWEVSGELQQMRSGVIGEASFEAEEAAPLTPGSSQPQQARKEEVGEMQGALRRRVASIRQGVQAVEVGKGQQARLSKWEKARSDTHSIMSSCFSEAHREVEEEAVGLPSRIRSLTAAVSAASDEAKAALQGDAPMRYTFSDGLINPASMSMSPPGHERRYPQDAEEFGPESQVTTASQGSHESGATGAAKLPVDRILGNGTVLMQQTHLQSMFGVPVEASILEPRIILQCPKVSDTVAADALCELEKEWLTAEGKKKQPENPAQDGLPASQGPQVSSLPTTEQGTPATKQKRVSFASGSQLPTAPKPSGRQMKKKRVNLEEGFS